MAATCEAELALDLDVGTTFKSFEDFKRVIQRRHERYNEVLVKGNGNMTVARANAKLKNKDLAYRGSFAYAWVNYRCIHEGAFKTKGEKRDTKSNRLNCPVKLRLVAKKDKDVLEIVSCTMNHNHVHPSREDCHYACQRKMTQEQANNAAQLTNLGVTTTSVQAHLRETTGIKFRRTDITNAVFKKKTDERGGKTVEEETWKVLIDMVGEDDRAQFSVVGDQDKNVSFIFFQTASMRSYLPAFPRVVLVDGTYCVNNLGYPLYVFLVVDNDYCGHAVAYAVTKNETEITLRDVVTQFVSLNPDVKGTKTFIVDKDQAEISALKAVMPESNILLCRFHVAKTFEDCIPKYTKGLDETTKMEAKSHLKRMLFTDDEYVFEYSFSQLPEDVKKYVQKNWLPSKECWAQFMTKSIITWGNFTNNCLERHNRKLKTISNHHKSLPQLIKQILKLHENEDIKFHQKGKDLQLKSRVVRISKGPAALVKELEAKTQILSPAACKMLKQQIEKIPQESRLQVNMEERSVQFNKSESEVTIHKITENGCSCLFSFQTRLPCWHIMYFKLLNGEAALNDIPDHWLLRSFTDLTNNCDIKSGCSAVQVVKRKNSKRLNEIEKRSMATELWKEALEGMVACGHKDFLDRCEVLKYIGDVWRSGKDVMSIDVGLKGKDYRNDSSQPLVDDLENLGNNHDTDSLSSAHHTDSLSSAHQTDGLPSAHQIDGLSSAHQTDSLSSAHHTDSLSSAHQIEGLSSAHQIDGLSSAHHTDSPSSAYQTDSLSSAHQTDSLSSAHQIDSLTSAHQTDSLSSACKTDSLSFAQQTYVLSSAHQTDSLLFAQQTGTLSSAHHMHSLSSAHQTDTGDLNCQTINVAGNNQIDIQSDNLTDNIQIENLSTISVSQDEDSVRNILRKKLLRKTDMATQSCGRGNALVQCSDVSPATSNCTEATSALNSYGLKFAEKVRKRGRPKGSGKTSIKSHKKKKVVQNEDPTSDTELPLHRIPNPDICSICHQQTLNNSTHGAPFCEWIKCDCCSRWFHRLCAFGCGKSGKAMKYVCSFCRTK